MRKTRQREAIRKVVRSSDRHPTADDVYEMVRREVPGISLGTVYRNLKVLAAQGELQVLEGGSGVNRYDGCARGHPHFTCDVCGRVYDVSVDYDADVERRLAAATGFEVRCHALEFRGVCARCRSDGR